MRLWSLSFKGDSTPFLSFKGKDVGDIEKQLKEEVFKVFYRVHRDKIEKIKEIENSISDHKYKALYNLIFPRTKKIYKWEYLVDLLNTFNIEI